MNLVAGFDEMQHVTSYFGTKLEGYMDETEENEGKYLVFALALAFEKFFVAGKGQTNFDV